MKWLISKIVLVAAVAFALAFGNLSGSALATNENTLVTDYGVSSGTVSSDGQTVTLMEYIKCQAGQTFQFQVYLSQGSTSGTGWQWTGVCTGDYQYNTLTNRSKGSSTYTTGTATAHVYGIIITKNHRELERDDKFQQITLTH